MRTTPLGKEVAYASHYAPELLIPVERTESRRSLALTDDLPFSGVDIWNAYELTWLTKPGRPVIAAATIEIPAESPCIVESKSLKLYLNSLSGTRLQSDRAAATLIATDVGKIAGAGVEVAIWRDSEAAGIARLPGTCIDGAGDVDSRFDATDVSPSLLCTEDGQLVSEELYSELLRSQCPVTGQPDSASILIRYQGPRIQQLGLLRYLASYRQHSEFHEGCVERVFADLCAQCRPEKLTVYARFNRRGGIDINPFRSNFEDRPPNIRLWRQ